MNRRTRRESKTTREVTETKKDPSTGNVVALHNPNAEWSPRSVEEAIVDIEDRGIEYFSPRTVGQRSCDRSQAP